MPHEILYHCSHLEAQLMPLPPSYPSSFADFSPLSDLYFCEECDAIRCDQCVAAEVASYYCPNCLFDVPGANVRQDRNRCSRSCFACPECTTALSVLGTETLASSQLRSSTSTQGREGGGYILICPACKWSSREIGWLFEKAAGLAGQLAKMYTVPQEVNAEFDAIKAHLEKYLAQRTAPDVAPGTAPGHRRLASRNIAQITQAARGALNRDLSAQPRPRHSVRKPSEKVDKKLFWDELKPYESESTWRAVAVERGLSDVERMKEMTGEEVVPLESRWTSAWEPPRLAKHNVPQRIPLMAKLTKRCPHPTCRHILIQPDTKSTRMLIKMVALNYLPEMEIGRRRLQLRDEPTEMTEDEMERRRRERKRARLPYMGPEKDEDMDAPMRAGETYSFQLAFTNPLYDLIQIRVGTAHQSRHLVPPNHHVFIPTPHFTVGASKDAWAYDDDDYDESGGEDDMATADERSKRMSSMLGGSLRRGRDAGIEKRGNVTKAALEVQVLPGASGPIEFDLEIRFTYRVEEEGENESDPDAEEGKDEYKTFTFWVRVCAGEVVA